MSCNHSTAKGGCDHCWVSPVKPATGRPTDMPDYDRCAGCGKTLIADGTEEADFATLCPDCQEEWLVELNGDQDEPL